MHEPMNQGYRYGRSLFNRLALLLALVLALNLPPAAAWAECLLYTFAANDPPQELTITAHAVADGTATITLTFAGDCTLGGEISIQSSRNSFASRVAVGGMGYPFAELQTLFATDDCTIVNLEGVLSDSRKGKVKKTYNFLGSTAYAGILTAGSVECVNLANNHALDYGKRGLDDTIGALQAARIAFFDQNKVAILEKDGVRIGFTASLFGLGATGEDRLAAQMAVLKDLGCVAIIHTMHAGVEYQKHASHSQRVTAAAAVKHGATLVVGHHPHVVQPVALLGNVPAVYSLGNCSFGGNLDPRDYDAALLRAVFTFEDGAPASLTWKLHPICVSGERKRNNFQPVLLTGEDAARVVEKMGGVAEQTIRYER
ncbi:MAG: CapA family protein [Clostridia bacterium]